jgi:hypothetical protein
VGLLPDQFFDMTWANYNRYAYGFIKRQAKDWEHTRTIVSMIYNANVGKRQDQKKPEQILPLWTDNIGKPQKPKPDPISKDDFIEVVKKLDNNG